MTSSIFSYNPVGTGVWRTDAVANVGVHGKSVKLRLQDLWINGVTITTGLVSATTTPMLLKLVAQGKLSPENFVTHRFQLDQMMDAYDTFGRAAETKAMKAALASVS